jgi:protein-tyrosine phosphatase
MAVEIFDSENAPVTKLFVEIYRHHEGYIPNWHLEIPDHPEYDIEELETLIDYLRDIKDSLEKLYDMVMDGNDDFA